MGNWRPASQFPNINKLLVLQGLEASVSNLIRGGNRSLNHRKFVAFLDEVNAVYGDLQMHTEIRWMSRGKCLERFFALRIELPVLLEDSIRCDTSAYCSKLSVN